MFSAPYFGSHESLGIDFAKKAVTGVLSGILDEFAVVAPLPLHKVCKSKAYVRTVITGRKATPLMSLSIADSCFKNHDRALSYASNVDYPYLLVLAEKDSIVSNKVSRQWHDQTSSKTKVLKLIAGAYHELTKEPNNHMVFETCLKFMAQRLQPGPNCAKAFGEFSIKKVKFAPQKPMYKKRRFWVLLTFAYLLIGLLIAVVRRQKKLFFSWPSLLVIAKRLR